MADGTHPIIDAFHLTQSGGRDGNVQLVGQLAGLDEEEMMMLSALASTFGDQLVAEQTATGREDEHPYAGVFMKAFLVGALWEQSRRPTVRPR